MSNLQKISKKIYSLNDLKIQLQNWRDNGDSIVFTNGCFDILHQGHIEVLAKTADLGNRLIIGLNSDSSVKLLKGENRPINEENARTLLLCALTFVDAVILFSEELSDKNIQKDEIKDFLDNQEEPAGERIEIPEEIASGESAEDISSEE